MGKIFSAVKNNVNKMQKAVTQTDPLSSLPKRTPKKQTPLQSFTTNQINQIRDSAKGQLPAFLKRK